MEKLIKGFYTKKRKNIYFFIILTFNFSCSMDESDAKLWAEVYCNCMKKNGAPKAYESAFNICDLKLKDENRYYRLFNKDYKNRSEYIKYSEQTRDSIRRFANLFILYTDSFCCKENLRCK